ITPHVPQRLDLSIIRLYYGPYEAGDHAHDIALDRAATATDTYAAPKRLAKTCIETNCVAMMRHDNGRIDQQQHKFKDDPAYIDKISKDRDGYRIQARNVWVESETNNDPLRRNDYRDEYLTAKQSVLNTKKDRSIQAE
ncbi:unnamed protein product, partial [Rotaria sordida]